MDAHLPSFVRSRIFRHKMFCVCFLGRFLVGFCGCCGCCGGGCCCRRRVCHNTPNPIQRRGWTTTTNNGTTTRTATPSFVAHASDTPLSKVKESTNAWMYVSFIHCPGVFCSVLSFFRVLCFSHHSLLAQRALPPCLRIVHGHDHT